VAGFYHKGEEGVLILTRLMRLRGRKMKNMGQEEARAGKAAFFL
jgi:hypothetical protein